MHDKLLEYLRRNSDYVSGEDLSRHLAISRQALWKHIHNLKDAGYDIAAVPHLGYRFISAPDRIFSQEIAHQLHTKVMGKRIYYFDTVSSTMDIATTLGQERSPEGTLVVSETQSKGRGRMHRSWFSPKYKGIYCSLILRPKIAAQEAPVLTLLSAVSVTEAIREATGCDARIKWPNDILIRHKKVGGILTELIAETDEVRFMVIGIGINVNADAHDLLEGATSLKDQNKSAVSRVRLVQEMLWRFEDNYLLFQKKGGAPVLEKWRSLSLTLGRRVRIMSRHSPVEGEAIDVDESGALLLRTDSGLVRSVTAGDVVDSR